MCVSAEASFGLTGLLVPVGIYCMTVASQRDGASLPLAAIPLVFGLQQFCEGLVWIGLGQQNVELTRWAAIAYLFFAIAFWLFWIPFSAAFLEGKWKLKCLLALGALLGLAGGLLFYLPLLLNPNVLEVRMADHSIRYDFTQSPALELIPPLVSHLCYLAVVTWPLILVSGKRKGLLSFGIALTISGVISHAYFW